MLQLRKGKKKGIRPRGVTMSLADFLSTGDTLAPHRRTEQDQEDAGDNLENQRVLGHEQAGGATQGDVRRIRGVLHDLKNTRRIRKKALEDQLHGYGDGEVDAFKHSLEQHSAGLAAAQISNGAVAGRLGNLGYTVNYDREKLQTTVHRDGRHVYTLHSGPSAFQEYRTDRLSGLLPATHGAVREHEGRQLYRKRGSGQTLYVADDYGVPTRRDAYAVKSGNQVDRLHRRGFITGRHTGVRGLAADTPTEGELANLGEGPSNRRLSDDEVLYLHQEFGSSDRQRGVSATSTAKPLLSNAGDGFANTEYKDGDRKFLANDPRALKLRIDTARIPERRRDEAPVFVNLHHRIPGLRRPVIAPDLYDVNREGVRQFDELGQPKVKYGGVRNQQHFDRSVGKNRELFIRTVTPRMVASYDPVVDRERFLGPPTRTSQRAEQQKAYEKIEAPKRRQREKEERGRLARLAHASKVKAPEVQAPVQDEKSDSDD